MFFLVSFSSFFLKKHKNKRTKKNVQNENLDKFLLTMSWQCLRCGNCVQVFQNYVRLMSTVTKPGPFFKIDTFRVIGVIDIRGLAST